MGGGGEFAPPPPPPPSQRSEGSFAGANPEDQDAVDRRQNNKMNVSASPLRSN